VQQQVRRKGEPGTDSGKTNWKYTKRWMKPPRIDVAKTRQAVCMRVRVCACARVCMCVSPLLLPPLSLSLSLKIIQLWPRLSLDASRPIGGGGIAGDISKYHRSLRDLLRRVYRRRDRGDVMSPSVRCKRNSARISSLVNANVYGRLVVPS